MRRPIAKSVAASRTSRGHSRLRLPRRYRDFRAAEDTALTWVDGIKGESSGIVFGRLEASGEGPAATTRCTLSVAAGQLGERFHMWVVRPRMWEIAPSSRSPAPVRPAWCTCGRGSERCPAVGTTWRTRWPVRCSRPTRRRGGRRGWRGLRCEWRRGQPELPPSPIATTASFVRQAGG